MSKHGIGTLVMATINGNEAIGTIVAAKGGWTTVELPSGELAKVRNSAVTEAPAPIVETTPVVLCQCGCGLATGKRSVFRQGHDQRLKGILLRRFDAGDQEAGLELLTRGWRTSAELNSRATAAEAKAAKAAQA